jgi:hypothetical protein
MAIAKGEAAEAIPFGLIVPVGSVRKLFRGLGFHWSVGFGKWEGHQIVVLREVVGVYFSGAAVSETYRYIFRRLRLGRYRYG